MFFRIASLILLIVLLITSQLTRAEVSRLHYSVFYYPGWKAGAYPTRPDPWLTFKEYHRDREPLLGWYDEDNDQVISRFRTMWLSGGIDSVIFDWYWEPHQITRLSHAIDRFRSMHSKQSRLKFSILWANASGQPSDLMAFESMVRYWISNYFTNVNFEKIDGRNLVYIHSPGRLVKLAENFGISVPELLNRARDIARRVSGSSIFFVACAEGSPASVSYVKQMGFDATTAYNYHFRPDQLIGRHHSNVAFNDYRSLSALHQLHWAGAVEHANLPYFVAANAGWDNAPWHSFGSEPSHVKARPQATVDFEHHLRAASSFAVGHASATFGRVVICCWNEFGEGTFVEPTKRDGSAYLDTIAATKREFLRMR